MYERSSAQNTQRFARENKSPSFTPVPLKHIRDVFRLFCISSGRIIVILCFPQALKNDFMPIVARSKENEKDRTFHWINEHPIFPGWLCREHHQDCAVNVVSPHWSLLMSTVSGAFFIREAERERLGTLPSPVLLRQTVYWWKRPPGESLEVLVTLKSGQPAPESCYWHIHPRDLPCAVYKLSHVEEWYTDCQAMRRLLPPPRRLCFRLCPFFGRLVGLSAGLHKNY